MIASWQETDDETRQFVEKQRNYSADGLPSGHVRLWEPDCKEGRMPKNWCLWTVVLEKTLESPPWTARRLNQSILREIHPEYSLEGLMLKLKLQYFGHLMWTADLLEKSLMLGKIKGRMSISDLSNESSVSIRWPKSWSFSFSISPSKEYSGLITFKIDWFDLLAFQGTLKSSPAPVQKHQFFAAQPFFIVQLSHTWLLEKP